jgi:hypothetical protein
VQGIWGQTVNSDKDHPANRYWIANEQVMFNLNNMIGGYNPNRFWSFIPFLGAGIGRSMTHDIYAMNLSCGILNQFRLSEKMALNLELGWNHAENDLDGNAAIMTHKTSNTWEDKDNNLYAEVGLTFNIGKSTWEKTPDVDAIKSLYMGQIDALNGAVDTATSYNLGTFRKFVLELLDFLLLLLLWADHEEPHDSKDGHHHDNHAHTATVLCCLCSEYKISHFLSL